MSLLDNLMRRRESLKLIKVWEFNSSSDISVGPVAGKLEESSNEAVIVFGTKDGRLYVINDESKVKWLYDLKEKLSGIQSLFLDSESSFSIYTTPVLYDINKDGKKEIIFGSENGILFVLDADGNLVWKFKTSGKIRSDILVADVNEDDFPEIVFGASDGFLYCLDYTGSVIWRYDAGSPIESAPALLSGVDDDIILFGTNEGKLFAVNSLGMFKWDFKAKDKITAKPIISHIKNTKEKFIVFGSFDHSLYCISSTGSLVWSFETDGKIVSEATIADINSDGFQEIVFGSCDNKVYALDRDGKELWNFETDFWIVNPPIVTDLDSDGELEIIVGSFDHSVYVIDAEGSFVVNYVPGVSPITPQLGNTDFISSEDPGEYKGRLLYKYDFDGMVVGTHLFIDKSNQKYVVIGIKTGKINNMRVAGGVKK
ncbi:MAG TPA: hypothetical protein ENN46_02100 [Candidatus Woesearchaeota archaeon]|nr:hypothetical protein [Candidatus Woesearchaeota archaeon]